MINKLIFVQWSNELGGLEKITQLYEEIFQQFNPIVAVLRFEKNGLKYKNRYEFRNSDKFLFLMEYLQVMFPYQLKKK